MHCIHLIVHTYVCNICIRYEINVYINLTDKCPQLQQPSNGRILYQPQTSYAGSEVIYQCDSQAKEIARKCLPGGMWESLAAECKS